MSTTTTAELPDSRTPPERRIPDWLYELARHVPGDVAYLLLGLPLGVAFFTFLAEGRSNAAIAATLGVSDGAVEKHVSSIFGKLGLMPSDNDHRRVLAVLAYLGH